MNQATVAKARDEALRFISLCKSLGQDDYWITSHRRGTKRTAAVRRASMDLTRALAEMRKAGQP